MRGSAQSTWRSSTSHAPPTCPALRPRRWWECIGRLDHYAKCIGQYTESQLPRFRANRQSYDNSEAKFRVVTMLSMLGKTFGVRYNPAKKPEDVPLATEDVF